ncbi:MAG: hypothetical protein AABZ39_04915 [Spirochaetota bacterium]
MQKVSITYSVYAYDELFEAAQNRAIQSAIKCFLNTPYERLSEDMQIAVDKAESMQTPWFAGEYIWDNCRDEIIAFCQQFEYRFNGNVFTEENENAC